MSNDPVNHPAHYTRGNIEVIDFIEDKYLPYHLGNCVKYICRAGYKDPSLMMEDLKKAEWYLHRYISFMGGQAAEEERRSWEEELAIAEATGMG